jgi:hypothetical protein
METKVSKWSIQQTVLLHIFIVDSAYLLRVKKLEESLMLTTNSAK